RLLSPFRAASTQEREDADLRDLIQRIALSDRHYGYRRILHELRRLDRQRQAGAAPDARGQSACSPSVAVRPQTTMSRHGFEIAPNLTRGLKPTGLDQIRAADISVPQQAA